VARKEPLDFVIESGSRYVMARVRVGLRLWLGGAESYPKTQSTLYLAGVYLTVINGGLLGLGGGMRSTEFPSRTSRTIEFLAVLQTFTLQANSIHLTNTRL